MEALEEGRGVRPLARILLNSLASLVNMATAFRTSSSLAQVILPGAFSLILTTALPGQGSAREPHVIQWWEGAAVLGGIAALSVLDEPVQQDIQGHRSPAGDNLASTVRRMGEVEVFGTVAGGMFFAGVVAHRPALSRASVRIAASLTLAGILSSAGKLLSGRPRPNEAGDADDLKLFSGHQAFPSGHTTMAFALATSLANEIKRPWASVGLFAAAAGTGWSRLNDNKHWLSDVIAGAAVGVTSAELIYGRWAVFHVHAPAFLVGPAGLRLGWHVTF